MSVLRKSLSFEDENGKKIYHLRTEAKEQKLAEEYIKPEYTILELGARYGTVSCVANRLQANPTQMVVVEPDSRVWDALEKNKAKNNCSFHICKGFLSRKPRQLTELQSWNGYGTTSEECSSSTIPSYTLEELPVKDFDCLIADCEGFLGVFLEENPGFLNNLKMILFEKDYPKKCSYSKIKKQLAELGFVQKCPLFREVWIREKHTPPFLV